MSQSVVPDTDNREVALIFVTLQILGDMPPFTTAPIEKRVELFVDTYRKLATGMFGKTRFVNLQ